MKNKKNPFEVERLRAELAEKGKYKELKKMYSKTYPEIRDKNTAKMWDYLNLEGRELITSNPMEEDRLHTVSSFITGDNLTILNIGFGSANLEEKYFAKNAEKSITWCGIDISKASVKNAQRKFPKAQFSVGAIAKLQFPKNIFDYVLTLEVIEHIKPSEVFGAYKEIYRVLKPGGKYIVSVPMNEGLEAMISRGENPNAHVRTFTPELLKAELHIAGFTIIKEKKLFAFDTFYVVKSFLAKTFFKNKFHFNNIIILAQKPLK